MYGKEDVCTDKEETRNILSNPLRFEDMNMMRHTKTIGLVEIEPTVWKHLTDQDKQHILQVGDLNLE